MDEWNGCIDELMNIGLNELMNIGLNEWMNIGLNEWMNIGLNELMNIYGWRNGGKYEWMNDLSELINKSINEYNIKFFILMIFFLFQFLYVH